MEEKVKNELYKHLDMFAKNLKLERIAKGLTQKQLAEMLDIKPQSYQAYEKGVTLPSVENLIKISMLLSLSLDELFEINN